MQWAGSCVQLGMELTSLGLLTKPASCNLVRHVQSWEHVGTGKAALQAMSCNLAGSDEDLTNNRVEQGVECISSTVRPLSFSFGVCRD